MPTVSRFADSAKPDSKRWDILMQAIKDIVLITESCNVTFSQSFAPTAELGSILRMRGCPDVGMDVMIADVNEQDPPMEYVRFLDSARSEDSKLMTDNAIGLAETENKKMDPMKIGQRHGALHSGGDFLMNYLE